MQSEDEPTARRSAVREKAYFAKASRCTSLIAVLENPSDIGNLGSVLRNVDALGAAKLYVVSNWPAVHFGKPGRNGEQGNPRLRKTSASADKWTYARKFSTTEECHEHLRRKGFVSLATSPHRKDKETLALETSDFTQYRKLAVWFGNETFGLSEEAIRGCDACVQVQMCGMVESLNLAVCSGIVLHAIATQRRKRSTERKANSQFPDNTLSRILLGL